MFQSSEASISAAVTAAVLANLQRPVPHRLRHHSCVAHSTTQRRHKSPRDAFSVKQASQVTCVTNMNPMVFMCCEQSVNIFLHCVVYCTQQRNNQAFVVFQKLSIFNVLFIFNQCGQNKSHLSFFTNVHFSCTWNCKIMVKKVKN